VRAPRARRRHVRKLVDAAAVARIARGPRAPMQERRLPAPKMSMLAQRRPPAPAP
jgi:hypothetical protein